MPNWLKALLIFLIAIIIVVVGVIAYFSTQPSPTPTPSVHTNFIINRQVTVNHDDYNDYKFNIPSGNVSNIYVLGMFSAEGGSGNDIKVYVFDAYNYGVYKLNGFYDHLYYSGQVNNASISANLTSSGDYYLVLDNLFSPTSSKTVTIQANVTYTITS